MLVRLTAVIRWLLEQTTPFQEHGVDESFQVDNKPFGSELIDVFLNDNSFEASSSS
ncbi:hypothetical protein HanIR_Chr11g0519521 [Helianthus annuus]|nr:hypothetical protein HanIR_Chr11g0519521 [Helianthus annuus]